MRLYIHHIHSWVLFLLWLCLFILSGVISPLFSSSILSTYLSGEFIFQCPIFLPFHTVRGVLKARILKWFAIPLSPGRGNGTNLSSIIAWKTLRTEEPGGLQFMGSQRVGHDLATDHKHKWVDARRILRFMILEA